MIPSWQLHLSSRRSAGQEVSNAEPTAPIRRRRPEYSRGQGREEHRFEHENIFTSHEHFLLRGRLQIARGGGRGPRRARRQRGAAAPSGDDRAGEREHHEKRFQGVKQRVLFHKQGGAFDRLSMCKASERGVCTSMNWRAVWRSNIFLHQLAGRVRPVELVRPVQLITLAAPAGRRVNYQAATRRIHGPAGRTAARRVERRPVDGARTARRVHGRRFPPVEEPRQ